jgi:hypothetical protein
MRVPTLWVCALVVAIGGALRVASATGDFWLDEAWTWFSVGRIDSALDVFTGIHHSNNNHLNSLWLYTVRRFGEPVQPIVYRIPSLVAGTASIALAALLGARRGRLEAVLAAILTAACFALLHFSSEARGYAPAVFFTLAAYAALLRDLERPRMATALTFGACVVGSFLSHLVALYFWAGAVALSAWRLGRREPPLSALLGLVRLHALPLACFALLYWLDLRVLNLGLGDPTPIAWLVGRVVGFTLGLPPLPALAIPYALLAAGIVVGGLVLRARARDDTWILFAVTIALAPAGVLLARRPEIVAVRYFLVCIAFSLLLVADLLARGLRAGGAWRVASLAALLVFLVGNAVHTAAFLEHGRGSYRAALLAMAAQSPGRLVRVGSDHDRSRVVLQFYARDLPEDRELAYYPQGQWPRGGPDWYIEDHRARPEVLARSVRDAEGNRYTLAGEYEHAAISGLFWAVYRNDRVASPGVAPGSDPPSRRRITRPKP